ncbi:rhodanese-like domain-containing protein [Anaeromyxobacter oryzae]|uniref:Rhodanese domain-containing protein n=1 Tax=Anaeromyxobacter oryzae TaxID=2918170 RepID=A0ABM7WRX8_9BACT|nr:rhodanese-like domain-containing protein [Anaeromyxobacter oryzae]BDG02242.1 hypothetical protein AMOR_12380 [Anaeromyxobacter oryzae]
MVLSTTIAVLLAAAPVNAPAEFRVVDAPEVHALLVGGRAVVVDVRSPQEYAEAHIPGALGIPADRITAQSAALPRDRATPVVFYCRGMG